MTVLVIQFVSFILQHSLHILWAVFAFCSRNLHCGSNHYRTPLTKNSGEGSWLPDPQDCRLRVYRVPLLFSVCYVVCVLVLCHTCMSSVRFAVRFAQYTARFVFFVSIVVVSFVWSFSWLSVATAFIVMVSSGLRLLVPHVETASAIWMRNTWKQLYVDIM